MTEYTLPKLPYEYDALEPHIDARTMEIHHTKHHAAYVSKLNAALQKHPDLFTLSLDALLANLGSVPEEIRAEVRNNGGGHHNHSLFWNLLAKNDGKAPSGELVTALEGAFASLDSFKRAFEAASLGRFGSGWAWLSLNALGGLVVHSTPNQDSPLMEGLVPIIGLDLWEHAYYLAYQNRRADYVNAFWSVLNWSQAGKNYLEAQKLQSACLSGDQLLRRVS